MLLFSILLPVIVRQCNLSVQVQFPNGTLLIFEVTREDAGPYLCRLANAGGMVYHNTTLTVRSQSINYLYDDCIQSLTVISAVVIMR